MAPLAQESLSANVMPRRITIILSGPPGDSLRVAREHFHEYIKPVLVAGALDWDVIEGRHEGEVRAGLAEKIRKLRRRNAESADGEPPQDSEPPQNSEEDLLEQARTSGGVKDWDGVQGDLVLGRHTWKEYIRGLHEGWLGTLEVPVKNARDNITSATLEISDPLSPANPPPSSASISSQDSPKSSPDDAPSNSSPSLAAPAQSIKKSPSPPSILPADYAAAALPSTIPPFLTPTVVLPLPHLLGFLNTPTRLYRFLTRRHLADATGASVAALVLANNSRPYTISTAPIPPTENETISPPSPTTKSEPQQQWEQETILRNEEAEWHKSAWTDDEKDAADEKKSPRDRVWREEIIIDDRIGERMRLFELDDRDRERAFSQQEAEIISATKIKSWVAQVKTWLDLENEDERGPKGWEMGLVGNEDE